MMKNQDSFEDFMRLQKEISENNLIFSLTNGRSIKEGTRKKVLDGYSKIMSLMSRVL